MDLCLLESNVLVSCLYSCCHVVCSLHYSSQDVILGFMPVLPWRGVWCVPTTATVPSQVCLSVPVMRVTTEHHKRWTYPALVSNGIPIQYRGGNILPYDNAINIATVYLVPTSRVIASCLSCIPGSVTTTIKIISRQTLLMKYIDTRYKNISKMLCW